MCHHAGAHVRQRLAHGLRLVLICLRGGALSMQVGQGSERVRGAVHHEHRSRLVGRVGIGGGVIGTFTQRGGEDAGAVEEAG